MTKLRSQIIETYAQWTSLSALRIGAPIRSRTDVYSAVRAVPFDVLFDRSLGTINGREFDRWHRSAIKGLIAREPRLNVGWAAKIVNVYLKTRCYIGAEGRHHLNEVIHPPIDSGLWLGLRRRFGDRPDILEQSNCVKRIKDINDYDCYSRIIAGCRAAAREMKCKLIEVEQLWAGTEYGRRKR
jgi:hypothetical protein